MISFKSTVAVIVLLSGASCSFAQTTTPTPTNYENFVQESGRLIAVKSSPIADYTMHNQPKKTVKITELMATDYLSPSKSADAFDFQITDFGVKQVDVIVEKDELPALIASLDYFEKEVNPAKPMLTSLTFATKGGLQINVETTMETIVNGFRPVVLSKRGSTGPNIQLDATDVRSLKSLLTFVQAGKSMYSVPTRPATP